MKGELKEFRGLLNHEKVAQRKEGVKKVIAAMMMGRDVGGPLFMDMLKNMHTTDLEMKKMVYLYLLSYSSTEPDFVLLSINTFLKDCRSPNSLVRALAIRTMCSLRVPKILEYLIEPLITTLQSDPDPLVKRTSALGVAKLYQTAPSLVVGDAFEHDADGSVGTAGTVGDDNNNNDNSYNNNINNSNSLTNPTNSTEDGTLLGELEYILEDPSCHSSILSNGFLTLKEITKHQVLSPVILENIISKLDEYPEWSLLMVLDKLSLSIKDVLASHNLSSLLPTKLTPLLQHSNVAIVIGTIRLLLEFSLEITTKRRIILTVVSALRPCSPVGGSSQQQLWLILRFTSSILPTILEWIYKCDGGLCSSGYDSGGDGSNIGGSGDIGVENERRNNNNNNNNNTQTIELLLTSLYVKATDSHIVKEEKVGLIVGICQGYPTFLPPVLLSSLFNLVWSWVVEESKCVDGDGVFVYYTVCKMAPLIVGGGGDRNNNNTHQQIPTQIIKEVESSTNEAMISGIIVLLSRLPLYIDCFAVMEIILDRVSSSLDVLDSEDSDGWCSDNVDRSCSNNSNYNNNSKTKRLRISRMHSSYLFCIVTFLTGRAIPLTESVLSFCKVITKTNVFRSLSSGDQRATIFCASLSSDLYFLLEGLEAKINDPLVRQYYKRRCLGPDSSMADCGTMVVDDQQRQHRQHQRQSKSLLGRTSTLFSIEKQRNYLPNKIVMSESKPAMCLGSVEDLLAFD